MQQDAERKLSNASDALLDAHQESEFGSKWNLSGETSKPVFSDIKSSLSDGELVYSSSAMVWICSSIFRSTVYLIFHKVFQHSEKWRISRDMHWHSFAGERLSSLHCSHSHTPDLLSGRFISSNPRLATERGLSSREKGVFVSIDKIFYQSHSMLPFSPCPG